MAENVPEATVTPVLRVKEKVPEIFVVETELIFRVPLVENKASDELD